MSLAVFFCLKKNTANDIGKCSIWHIFQINQTYYWQTCQLEPCFFGGKANEISISNFSQKTSPFEEIVFQRLKNGVSFYDFGISITRKARGSFQTNFGLKWLSELQSLKKNTIPNYIKLKTNLHSSQSSITKNQNLEVIIFRFALFFICFIPL